MTGTKTFARGGIHPHDYKGLTDKSPIRNAPIPGECVVAMHQHMGSPATCVVQKDDEVREGMLIGKAGGPFSANVHAPIPGVVQNVRELYLHNGVKSQVVVIALQGEFDQSGKSSPPTQWEQLRGPELLDRIQQSGIVGLGGATFPTPLKYKVREGNSVEYLVINGVECEPFLTADHRLMLEKTRQILTGIGIIQRILGPVKVLVGIEENKADALQAMEEAVRGEGLEAAVVPLKLRYPQGDEKQLLQALIGREVPSGGLPLDIGAVVSNVGTVFAIYEAVVLGKPLIERIVTVSGSCIEKPANLKVRLGTKIGELIEECGGFSEPPAKLIAGGPMMGFTLADLDIPVTKGVSGILALSRKEAKPASQTPCISCGRCLAVCPLGLRPAVLYKWIEHQQYEVALAEGLMDCKECGCCSYVCPARIPLVQGMKLGKIMTRKKKQ